WLIAEQGRLLVDLPTFAYPSWATNSVHLAGPLSAADLRLAGPDGVQRVQANVIGVVENQAPTRHLQCEVAVENGAIVPDPVHDLAKVALVERHRGTGSVQVGLVNGFGLPGCCALATTVAHDSHH